MNIKGKEYNLKMKSRKPKKTNRNNLKVKFEFDKSSYPKLTIDLSPNKNNCNL